MERLTDPQRELYEWLVEYIRLNQYSPSIRQMMEGMNLKINTNMIRDNPVRKMKGACQLEILAINKPKGTPTTEATENAAITKPMAFPLRESGITSPIIAMIKAEVSPPKTPDITPIT